MLSFWRKVRKHADVVRWRMPVAAPVSLPARMAAVIPRKSDTDGHRRRRRQTLYDNRLL